MIVRAGRAKAFKGVTLKKVALVASCFVAGGSGRQTPSDGSWSWDFGFWFSAYQAPKRIKSIAVGNAHGTECGINGSNCETVREGSTLLGSGLVYQRRPWALPTAIKFHALSVIRMQPHQQTVSCLCTAESARRVPPSNSTRGQTGRALACWSRDASPHTCPTQPHGSRRPSIPPA